MRSLVLLTAALALAGCAGKFDYVRPSTPLAPNTNTIVIEKPRNDVWDASVPQLGKQFFVINNLDRSSGLMNISYTGDPEKYIDCGRLTSYVKNARGERTYDFAGAKAQQTYEILEPGTGLFFIDRRMSLEGRVNLIFETVGPATTRVTANTRYVVTRSTTVRSAANNLQQSNNHSITFGSDASASFPPANNGQAVECVANGSLEREILSAIK